MPTNIYISLPVKDAQKSVAFYEALGYKSNPDFSDETTGSIAISDVITVMLASHEKFQEISPKPISDATKFCQVLLSLTCESREEVDALVSKAVAAGGTQAHEPEDYGFMYQSGFYDLDGHGWGLTWMNPGSAQ
ncbi:VOC family protein [Candidatus Peribacteria bacterium]|nr:MAG: VOC family protein [Candidatus Peribacteria bacterium]